MKLTNLIKTLAKQAGIETQKDLNEFLEANKESLESLELPDIAGNLMQENLWNEEVAKTKGTLKKHFAGLLFPGIEQGAKERAIEAGLTPDEVIQIHQSTQDSGQRVNSYIEALKSKLSNAGKNSKGNEEIMKQIQELQTKAIEIERSKNDEINSLKSSFNSRIEDLAWKNEVSKVKWNKAIPESVRSMALKEAIRIEVEKENGRLVFDDERQTWEIVNSADPTMKVSKAGKILDYNTLFPLALQEHKLLDIEPTGGAVVGNSGNPFFVPSQGQGNSQIPEYIQKSLGSANKPIDFSQS
jgi:hypothetical protein